MSVPATSTTPLDRTLRYQTKQIEKLLSNLNDILGNLPLNTINCSHLENSETELKQLRSSYAETVQQILLKCSDDEFEAKCESLSEVQNDLFETCRDIIAKSHAEITKFKGQRARESLSGPINSTEMPSFNASLSSNHYPKIQIPNFDGDYRKFMRFKGIFTNLVHDETSMPNVRKLYYLQDALTGEASRLIEDLPMTDSSYEEAWSRITTRYDNQKALVMIYFRELLAIRQINEPQELRSLLDTVTNAMNNLKLCGLPADNWGDLIAYIVYQCLDKKTKDDFDNSQSESRKFFTWKVLSTFLKGRAYCSETRKLAENEIPKFDSRPFEPAKVDKSKPAKKSAFIATHEKPSTFITREKCIACPEQHLLIACQVFALKTPRQRFELVSKNKMCANCFGRSHATRNCTRKDSCKKCGNRHHTLLHFEKPLTSAPSGNENLATNKSSSIPRSLTPSQPTNENQAVALNLVNSCSKAMSSRKTVFLPSAVVHILYDGVLRTARILLDSCSQVTLISEDFVRKFKLPVSKAASSSTVRGISDSVIELKFSCALSLISRFESFKLPVVAEVAPRTALTYGISGVQLPKSLRCLKGVPLADPALFENPVNIPNVDILLGAEYYEQCILNETKMVESLTLRNTRFGWVLSGPLMSSSSFCGLASIQSTCSFTIFEIESQLRKFIELEDVDAPAETVSDEKTQCVRHFDETHGRADDGKFQVRLPMKLTPCAIANNFASAQYNLLRSERNRSPEVQPEYIKFMKEYENLKHMSPVAGSDKSKIKYLIPHREVIRPTSTTTKVRVVFNASAKTASGYSLNDILMTGPVIQPDLVDILLRFRQPKYAFSADITKMYRCVWIHPDDRPVQCILWRETVHEPVKVYQLNTVTYGTAPASFLATKCLDVLSKSLPADSKAASAIAHQFYMDDLLTGADTLEECVTLQKTVHDTLASAGFILRKYQSNCAELLSTIEPSLVETKTAMSLSGENFISVLGVLWVPEADVFRLRVNKPLENFSAITKRLLLAEISKTFDPLGFAAPFTIRGKILMQRVWKESRSWDEPVSARLSAEFASYWREISELETFYLPRAYSPATNIVSRQLIGFSDASELAYCAVVYMRCVNSEENVVVSFVCAKTRVAPVKPLSIPRLELQAAWLLAQLLNRLSRILNIELKDVLAFSDSKVVLSWLSKPPSTWTVFVRNRVAKIVEILPCKCWSYVNTSCNPADLATRGVSVKRFLNSSLWASGPEFLNTKFTPIVYVDDSLDLEMRKIKVMLNINVVDYQHITLSNFSSFSRLVRSFAYVNRFVANCKAKIRSRNKIVEPSTLAADEICSAENTLIFITQRAYFSDVCSRLEKGIELSKKNPLRNLYPFLDEQKLLRVGGRLRHANLPYEKKHPLILPVNCAVTQLLVRHLHIKYYHAQKSFLLCHLRSKFWFYGSLTSVVKKCIRLCTICCRYDAKQVNQLMGDLPAERVVISRPFTNVGVDFAGPFLTKCVGHRSTIRFKSYVAIFVCLSTRAAHLEVVSQLSTDKFLSGLSRFIARRGRPSLIWSDNGTNFVGAASYLALADKAVADYSACQGIRWRFNPPRSPHRGGIWESAVKSMKKHLLRSTHGQTFTFEELATVICSVESILNSRPLCAKITADQENIVLTPAHFLIGDSLLSDPEPQESNVRLAKRYEIVRRTVSVLWKLWHKDYLSQLQCRNKWQCPQPNVTPGSIVILRDDLTSPNNWKYAIIEKVFPGSDGHVRTVDVRVDGSLKRRSISSLVWLPVDQQT